MFKVGQLIKFIQDLNPNQTPARLALYNFLKNYLIPEDTLNAQVLNQFFTYCLDYSHWQQNKNQLSHEVKYLIQNFNSFYQNKLELNEVQFPEDTQIIEIERTQDCLEVVDKYIKAKLVEGEKHRLFVDQNKKFIAVILAHDKKVKVHSFDKKFVIRGGQLEPLRTNMILHYTSQLELDPQFVQRIEVAPFITAQFKVSQNRCLGLMIRGYVFQKFLELKGEFVHEQPKLFIPIKRIEQFFIDRRTDTYYIELTSTLERLHQLLSLGDPETLKKSQPILDSAEIALENVYVGDKLLSVLVRDLKNQVKLKQVQNEAALGLNHGTSHGTNLVSNQSLGYSERKQESWQKITPLKPSDLINS